MSKRELNEVEIPAFLHIVTGILLEPRLHTTAPLHPDLLLECLDIVTRRTRKHHPSALTPLASFLLETDSPDKRRLTDDTWETLDAQAVDFAEKLPADVYKKARAVLRKRRQRHHAGTVLTK